MHDLSIVIVGYKTRGLIKNCLNSILKNLANTKLDYRIAVVDNDSQDGTVEMIRQDFTQVKLIEMGGNFGYSKAVNRGIRLVKAKYYFVLNPDTLFLEKNIVERIYNFMEKHPKIGMVGPKLINPDGSIQNSCCRFPSFFLPIYRRTKLGRVKRFAKKIDKFLMKDWDHDSNSYVDWVIGTGMFIRRKALKDVGLMDERFFMYFEDTDWCRRFWRCGWKVCYFSDVSIIHYHGRPSLKSGGLRDIFLNKGTRIHIKSWLQYFSKYKFNSQDNNKNMKKESKKREEKAGINFDSEQLDFVPSSKMQKPRKQRSWLKIVLGIVLIVVVFFAIYFYVAYSQAKKYAMSAKTNLENGYEHFINFNFVEAGLEIENSRINLEKATDKLTKLKPLTFVGRVDKNYQSADVLLNAVYDFTGVFDVVVDWSQQNIKPLKDASGDSISELPEEDKERFLEAVSNIDPTLGNIYTKTSNIRFNLADRPTEKVSAKLNVFADNFDSKLSEVESISLIAKDVLPTAILALGYPEEQLYFFGLQNNGELRPTGGYLGTYGVFSIKNAEFVDFDTYNTYHFDVDNSYRFNEVAPPPVKEYTNTSKWTLGYANWSPDFPTSADKIKEAYKVGSQDDRNFDGIVVIDPTPIVDLLAVTGPIEVEDITFDTYNFVDELEYYTYEGFSEEGVASRDRKELIGELGVKMIDYFLNSDLEKWGKVWDIVNDSLTQKHIMFNFDDKQRQKLVERQNWDNRVKAYDQDYLMVVDANLDSLKTDRFTDKDIEYKISQEDEKIIAQVKLTYANNAQPSEKTSDLKEYTRIYTPLGSEFIEISGNDDEVDMYQELGKQVYGALWNIPIGETREMNFKYELPRNVFDEDQYSVLVQKQAGTAGHDFKLNFDFGSIEEVYYTELVNDEIFDIRIK